MAVEVSCSSADCSHPLQPLHLAHPRPSILTYTCIAASTAAGTVICPLHGGKPAGPVRAKTCHSQRIGWQSNQSELGRWRSFMLFLKTQKKKLQAQKFLARMANQWSMDRVRKLVERRGEQRATLNVGVWVIPM